jgi:hypothetical protein
MNKASTLTVIALILMASGCLSSSTPQADNNQSDTNMTASEWCNQNNHGDAVEEGCLSQQELLEVEGEFYYAEENSGISCEDQEAYVCSQ